MEPRGYGMLSSELSTTKHANTQDVEKDQQTGETPLEERVFKLRSIYFLLQLLFWREAARRSRREPWTAIPVTESGRWTSTSGRHKCTTSTQRSDEGTSSRATSTQDSGTEVPPKELLDKKRKSRQSDDEGDDDGESEDWRPRHKKTKRGSIRSLNGQLACPFAKADPTTHLNCIMIGRKDLSGVKEHVRRNHFTQTSTTPSELLVAKTWDAVFDFCNPQWSPRPRPSPCVDMLELFMNFLKWNTPQPSEDSEARNPPTYYRLPDNTDEPLTQLFEEESGNKLVNGLSELPLLPNSTNTLEGYSNSHILQADTTSADSTFKNCTCCVPNILNAILTHNNPCTPSSFSSCKCKLSNFGITSSLGAEIRDLMAPHISYAVQNDLQQELSNCPAFFSEEYGLDPTWSSEQLYSAAMSNMDPEGSIFDASTGFAMHKPQYQIPFPSTDFGVGLDLQIPETIRHPINVNSQPNVPLTPFDTSFTTPHQNNTSFSTSPWVYSVPTITNIPPPIQTILDFGQSTTTQTLQTQYANPNLPKPNKKYTLLVSRRPVDPSSTETQGYKRFYFEDFNDFRRYFELWMTVEFPDPLFSWQYMEFYNDFREARLQSVDDVIDDLDGSFTHYGSTKASLFLVKKDKGKARAM
ncbi:hypothetical protein AA313_de0200649 [Arthrobotrys entomopaga]|nr:hypothetical protein AA313_de0200649 [Arthrobotrys entomopaga]